ncbi:pyrophosphatase-domain-containing protein [Xylona heveae TC161]|uniref:Inorganic pyrophosphatase n=1 Tax=Xylona heveae (strain CBS 132557 / TC161) TaxID=1328760 RepID=A0A165JAM2_XYLHT|nr:pyrophosphatase-domain-containing protein [Xylona heveae TC161]KZF25977.1 pyrophosphatase-domain-containing protein [Xylona heveae TC161]
MQAFARTNCLVVGRSGPSALRCSSRPPLLSVSSLPRSFSLTHHVFASFAPVSKVAPNAKTAGPPTTTTITTAASTKFKSRTALLQGHLSPSSPLTSSSIPRLSSSPPSSITMASLPVSGKGYSSKAASAYSARKIAQPNTLEHRVYVEKDGVPRSPWHDIPLYANEQQTILNMIVEIPRWTNGKLEISKEEPLNPIKQDVKKGKLRFVRNCFPHKGYLWNYGAFPQTWEDPNVVHPETKAKGDNDPLDVCEIGELVGKVGEIKQVKVLGVMALLDEEETDWKIIVIDVNDPLAPKLNDVEDVERHLPGLLRATNEWFRIYKIPDGKPENQFAFSGECKNKKYAMDIVRECAEAWERLIAGKTSPGDNSLLNTTVPHSAHKVEPSQLPHIPKGENLSPAPIDPSIDKWFFISGAAV